MTHILLGCCQSMVKWSFVLLLWNPSAQADDISENHRDSKLRITIWGYLRILKARR